LLSPKGAINRVSSVGVSSFFQLKPHKKPGLLWLHFLFINQLLVGEANKPSPGDGFFNGDYHALAQLEFRPSRRVILGLTYVHSRVTGFGDGEVWNWALTLAFPDLGKKGNLGGIIVGMEPKLTGGDFGSDPDTGLHIEAFYRYQLTDNIDLTPGVIWLTAPGHSDQRSCHRHCQNYFQILARQSI
jgi:hypothetical protein